MSNMQAHVATVGQFHTFGEAGGAYEVIADIDETNVKIRVVETGETLSYSRDQVTIDPIA